MVLSQPANKRALHRVAVSRIEEVAPHHYQITLCSPNLASNAKPGQFVHVLTNPNSENWCFDPLLRRAFSIMSVDSISHETIEVLFRAEGRGTQLLAKSRVGDEIDLIGPLGKPFDVSPFELGCDNKGLFHVKQTLPEAIVVGGGVGVPPLVFLSQFLRKRNVGIHAIIGARTASDIIGCRELADVSANVRIATDDGSRGHEGRVTDLLGALFDELDLNNLPVKPIVYSCGPLPMLRSVAQMCASFGIRCQVSLEENMPCGIGVCNGCVVRTHQPFGNDENIANDCNDILGKEWTPYQAYRRVCVEGPACWADEIDWNYQD